MSPHRVALFFFSWRRKKHSLLSHSPHSRLLLFPHSQPATDCRRISFPCNSVATAISPRNLPSTPWWIPPAPLSFPSPPRLILVDCDTASVHWWIETHYCCMLFIWTIYVYADTVQKQDMKNFFNLRAFFLNGTNIIHTKTHHCFWTNQPKQNWIKIWKLKPFFLRQSMLIELIWEFIYFSKWSASNGYWFLIRVPVRSFL